MPYLAKKDKEDFDSKYKDALSYLESMDIKKLSGHLNYMVFKTVKAWTRKNGKKYFVFAAVVGTMICCVLEIYRRLVAPYEDEKILENGDVE